MDSSEIIDNYIEEGIKARKEIDKSKVTKIADLVANSFRNGNKLLFMGNGGSAADSQHIAAEFVGRFEKEREALPALALHANSSTVTAIGNDYGFEKIFERQIEAFAKKGDVVFALSTSGNSRNVIEGIKKAKEKECIIVGITGRNGGKMTQLIEEDFLFRVNSEKTSIIQEVTITIGHILSKLVELQIYGD
ncbi:MAG: D-sedoheptulose-7-phosphate isomerase [Thermoplasmata archaeon]